MNKASNQNITNWLLLLSLTLIWGSSYILIKKGLVAFAPIELGVLRLSLSFLATSPFLYSALKDKSPKNYWRILTVGLLGTGIPVFPICLFHH
jgi:drug/metabolite transporter (DMT)-like permease